MNDKEHYIILHQNKVLRNLIFFDRMRARNYIKMRYPTRKFKEPSEDVFVCNRFGTTFKIIELYQEN